MTIDDDSCRKSATIAVRELKHQHPDIQVPDKDIQDLIVKHMVPLLREARAATSKRKKSGGKPKDEKGSSRPNHYAKFHSMCSAKGAPLRWALEEYDFKYQPEESKLNAKQKIIYDDLHKEAEKLKTIEDFTAPTGDLMGVIEFLDKEFKIDQMTRTSLIWNQFLSQADRDRFSAWYKEMLETHGEIPSQEQAQSPTPAHASDEPPVAKKISLKRQIKAKVTA
jgi:hypothetical protein